MIGIITLPNFMYYNYGGVLQNYALYKYLTKCGFNVGAIHCNANSIQGAMRMKIYDVFNIKILKTKKRIKIEVVDLATRKRNHNFSTFIEDNIHPLKYAYYSKKVYNKINNIFDGVVVGSDQVWNPSFISYSNMFDTFLLTFLPFNKKVSYASSFGISEIPKCMHDKYKKALLDFKAISVREEVGSHIVKELSGIDVEVLLDPTMLLTIDEWKQISKYHPNRRKKPYLLKYFLGEQTSKQVNEIEDIAKTFELEIYELANQKKADFYTSGPAEFLDLVEHAELVYTDSFHAVVFSILFGKPFVVMNRVQQGMDRMNSRIETLLFKLNLENHLPENFVKENLFECDYANAYKKLELERKRAKSFIKKNCNF